MTPTADLWKALGEEANRQVRPAPDCLAEAIKDWLEKQKTPKRN